MEKSSIQSKKQGIKKTPVSITISKIEAAHNKKTCVIYQTQRIDINGTLVDKYQFNKGYSADESAKEKKQRM